MELSDLNRDQALTVLGIIGILLGLLVVPPLLQKFYGISAVKVVFGVIVIYAILNWWMRRN